MTYRVLQTLSDGLVLVHHPEFGSRLFSKARIRVGASRTTRTCEVCKRPFVRGDSAYAVAGQSSQDRYVRLCTTCIESPT